MRNRFQIAAAVGAAMVVLILGIMGVKYFGQQAVIRSQRTAHANYDSLLMQMEHTALTVTEKGRLIGVYNLEQMGMLDAAKEAAEACFTADEKMEPADFAALPKERQRAYERSTGRKSIVLDEIQPDFRAVLEDLAAMERTASEDAGARLENGQYVTVPEIVGTELDEQMVEAALQAAVSGWVLTPEFAPHSGVELANCDPYIKPSVTAEDALDYAEVLRQQAEELTISVHMPADTVELEVLPLLSADKAGWVTVDREALEQTVSRWEGQYFGWHPYLFDSCGRGPVELDFLGCYYEMDRQTLLRQLEQQLLNLDTTEVTVQYTRTKDGEPYALDDTYIEVDIARQKMAYVEDGEVLVYTDVVTGLPNGRWTWPGLYTVKDLDEDRMLYGEDYAVYVNYWVGYFGDYGIHDGTWREVFGGSEYESNGSHGCINTPLEAMAEIYSRLEKGTQIIIHYEPEE